MTRQLFLAVALASALTGCGGTTPATSTEVDVTGTVTGASGAPLKDVELQFQATGGTARQATFTRPTSSASSIWRAPRPIPVCPPRTSAPGSWCSSKRYAADSTPR